MELKKMKRLSWILCGACIAAWYFFRGESQSGEMRVSSMVDHMVVSTPLPDTGEKIMFFRGCCRSYRPSPFHPTDICDSDTSYFTSFHLVSMNGR